MNNRSIHIKDIPTTGVQVLEVELYYEKGGMNYFSAQNNKRGYYLSVTPITKENGCTSFSLFSGIKKYVQEATRFSEKTMKEIAIDPIVLDELVSYVVTHSKGEITLA